MIENNSHLSENLKKPTYGSLRAFWIAPMLPCLAVSYYMGHGSTPNIFLFPYALLFCYIITWTCAFPIYSSLKRRGIRISLTRSVLFGAVLSWILPILISLLAGKSQSWFINAPPGIFYDLFYGALFGGSIGAIFFGLHTKPVLPAEKIALASMAVFAIFGQILVPVILGILWNLFFSPNPPPLDFVSENNYSSYNYGSEKAYEAVSAQSPQGRELKKALEKILPKGITRDKVERILSETKDEGTISFSMNKNDHYETEYIQRPGQLTPLKNGCKYFNWVVAVQYNPDQTLKSFKLSPLDGCGKVIEF